MVVVVEEVVVTVVVAGGKVTRAVSVLACVLGTVMVVEARVKMVDVEVLVVDVVTVLVDVVQAGVVSMQEQAVLIILDATLVSDAKAAGTVVAVAALFSFLFTEHVTVIISYSVSVEVILPCKPTGRDINFAFSAPPGSGCECCTWTTHPKVCRFLWRTCMFKLQLELARARLS